MNINELAGLLAGMLALLAYIPYVIGTVREDIRPEPATWIILAVTGMILTPSYGLSGARSTLWLPMGDTIGPVIMAALTIADWKGAFQKRFDRQCVYGAIVGLVLGLVLSSPLATLLCCLSVDFVAMLPTLQKAYKKPEDESPLTWAMTFVSCLLNIVALGWMADWSFAVSVYPMYMAVMSGLMTALLYSKR